MRSHSTERAITAAEPPNRPDFDRYASYEADGALVVCDRKDPRAWIRSSVTTTLDV